MRILILSNPRTGSKFFQRKIQEHLQRKFGKTVYLKLPHAPNGEFGLGELFTRDYRYSQSVGIQETDGVFTFSEKDDHDHFQNTMQSLSRCALPFVVKIHGIFVTDEFQEWANANIDFTLGLTRANIKEWAVSTSLMMIQDKTGNSHKSSREFRVKDFSQQVSIRELELRQKRLMESFDKMKMQKMLLDVSNLPTKVNVAGFDIDCQYEGEYSKTHDYGHLTRLVNE